MRSHPLGLVSPSMRRLSRRLLAGWHEVYTPSMHQLPHRLPAPATETGRRRMEAGRPAGRERGEAVGSGAGCGRERGEAVGRRRPGLRLGSREETPGGGSAELGRRPVDGVIAGVWRAGSRRPGVRCEEARPALSGSAGRAIESSCSSRAADGRGVGAGGGSWVSSSRQLPRGFGR